MKTVLLKGWTCLFLMLAISLPAQAEDVQVAVAANFAAAAQQIATEFQRDSVHHVSLSLGSTGQFYAQIHNGAPFDVLLAADADTPTKLEQEGQAVAGSGFTYAIGRLVLWSARAGFVDNQGKVLSGNTFNHLAIANPSTAPYGAAAMEILKSMGLDERLQSKLVKGENIGQTYQFVATGNAELGFVAMSQVYHEGKMAAGSYWLIPATLHLPLRQDAILLSKGANNPAAKAWLTFLRGPKARTIIKSYGYDL